MVLSLDLLLFLFISALPLYTEKPYAVENTKDVLINLLMVAITPYQRWAWFFHLSILLLVLLIILWPDKSGRIFTTYIGLNYFIIAFAQSFGITEKYGVVVHTGNLVMSVALGVIWLWVTFRGDTKSSFKNIRWYHFLLLPLAILTFWSPYKVDGNAVIPDFNPTLLLTSPDYGLTFCFTTPIFLYLLILFYPNVNLFAFRITSFNGLLYALFNLTHWFNPDSRWMGVLHIPLLVISIFALIQSRTVKDNIIAK